MFYDTRLTLATNQDFTVSPGPAGTASTFAGCTQAFPFTNPTVIDLQAAREIAEGHNFYAYIRITTSFATGGGTPFLVPTLITADDAALTTNVRAPVALGGGTPTLIGGAAFDIVGFGTTELKAGTELALPIGRFPVLRSRYLSMAFLQPAFAASFFSAGKLSVVVAPADGIPQNTIYANAV